MQTPTPRPVLAPAVPGQDPSIAGRVEQLGSELAGLRQTPSANAVYEALRHANNILREQQRELESQRRQLTRDIEQNDNAASQKGIEQRIATVDQRLAAMDKQ